MKWNKILLNFRLRNCPSKRLKESDLKKKKGKQLKTEITKRKRNGVIVEFRKLGTAAKEFYNAGDNTGENEKCQTTKRI